MATFHHFSDIQAWREAQALVADVYRLSAKPGIDCDYSFRDQWRRAAFSVMNNIAEGFAPRSDNQFSYFLSIARGSLAEVESMTYVAEDFNLPQLEGIDSLRKRCDFTASLIAKLTTYLRDSRVREDAPPYSAEVTSGLPDFRTSGLL